MILFHLKRQVPWRSATEDGSLKLMGGDRRGEGREGAREREGGEEWVRDKGLGDERRK